MIEYLINEDVSNAEMNALFSVGWPSWQTAPDTSDWQTVLNHSLAYVTARDQGRLAGFVNVAWDGRDHAFLLDTRVDPEYRHQGIGTEVVRQAVNAARSAGCVWLHVDFTPDLEPFYRACGFVPTQAGLIKLG